MATGSHNLTTWAAKRIIGDNSTAEPEGALLHNGSGRGNTATGDTWIFYDDASASGTPWGFKHDQPNDRISFLGSGTNTSWIALGTGDFYIYGKAGIGYDPSTSGNTYKLYVNGTSYFNGTLTINNTAKIPYIDSTILTVRHIDAGKNSVNADHNLYIGYGANTFTKNTYIYYSTGTDGTDTATSRTLFFTVNNNGAYASTRFGVDGQNTSYNFYVNGTSYFNGNILLKANQYRTDGTSGINANNSDIINVNALCFNDSCDTFNEGIMFNRSSGVWECMAANSSGFFFRGGTDGTPAVTAANANGTLFASVVWGEKVRVCSNWVGFYAAAGDTTTRYGYVQANENRMYFRKENGANNNIEFDFGGDIYTSGELISGTSNGLRIKNLILRNDDSSTYFLLGTSNTPGDNWNSLRPFYFNNTSGIVTMGHGLRVINDSSNTGDDALVYIQNQTTNDWAVKINKGGKNYGIRVDSLDQGEAIWTNGYVRARCVWANQGSNGERQCGVDSGTSGNLYLWANTSNKGLYSGSGYRTGAVITITSSATTFNGNAATATALGTNAGDVNTPVYFTGGKPAATNNKLGAVNANGFWGMRGADNGDSWIRTTSSGIIPVQSGGKGGGHCGLGTSGWYFSYAYIDSVYSNKTYGAVWNDIAECRKTVIKEPGRIVIENETGVMELSSKRLQATGRVISDTYGYCMGEPVNDGTPLAIAGRVLVYPYRPIKEYKLGDCVCAAPDGTVDIMTRKEIQKYPDRIIGIVSEIPNYEIWSGGAQNGNDDIKVNGRIWIYVR